MGSGFQEFGFSCKVLDVMNLRKGTNWQSHRSGFPPIALKDKLYGGEVRLKIVLDDDCHKFYILIT